ncbi:MAG TPA: M23 family metallopeptidase [Steroidobacteraceae bacterium]|nr:M23 family metallopeptidase [Steroidobacteraceae bacterium]
MSKAAQVSVFRIVMFAIGVAAVPGLGAAQTRTPIVSSIDAYVGSAPDVVTIAGREHLVYELHVTNFRSSPITLTRIEIVDAAKDVGLGNFSGAALSSRIGRPGVARDLADRRVVDAGMRAVVYFWLPLEQGHSRPSRVRHRISVEVDRAGKRVPVVVSAAEAEVRKERPLVLSAPLRGGPWAALYDPTLVGGHRTALYAVDGRARIPARFAIDFVRLNDDGTHARGDRNSIANWHGYGADVLAVADATVVAARDDIAESPTLDGSESPIPLENVSGNCIVLDLGGGRYAFYEHLQHGSVRVKAGDRVNAGDVIARLGNSGSSSSGPHLHFHVADAAAELVGEGAPYAFASFEAIGKFNDIDEFAAGRRWAPADSDAAGIRRAELPAPNSVISFRDLTGT